MAEKEKKSDSSKGKKAKKHLRAITTHKADDGSFVHEHHYHDENGQALPPSYGGVSTDVGDLQQHMADHFGAEADQGDQDEQAAATEPQGEPPAPTQAA